MYKFENTFIIKTNMINDLDKYQSPTRDDVMALVKEHLTAFVPHKEVTVDKSLEDYQLYNAVVGTTFDDASFSILADDANGEGQKFLIAHIPGGAKMSNPDDLDDDPSTTITVGDTQYATIEEALDAAVASGEPIQLTRNVTIVPLKVEASTTIDLNNQTLTTSSDDTPKGIDVAEGEDLVVENGKLVNTSSSKKADTNSNTVAIQLSGGSTASIKNVDITSTNDVDNNVYGINIADSKKVNNKWTTPGEPNTATIEDSTITADTWGVAIIGANNKLELKNTVITASTPLALNGTSGFEGNEIVIDGCTINATDGFYFPNNDKVTITNTVMTSTTPLAVSARAGEITLGEGNVITIIPQADSEKETSVGDRKVKVPTTAVLFDALAEYPGLKSNPNSHIAITGGKYILDQSANPDWDNDLLSACQNDDDTNQYIRVTGGEFSKQIPEKYIVDGYEQVETTNGFYKVQKKTSTVVVDE